MCCDAPPIPPTCYHKRWRCRFRDSTDRTSLVNRSASSSGSSDSRQMSIGSENQDLIGMALFGKQRYAPGELSMMNIWERKRKKKKVLIFLLQQNLNLVNIVQTDETLLHQITLEEGNSGWINLNYKLLIFQERERPFFNLHSQLNENI